MVDVEFLRSDTTDFVGSSNRKIIPNSACKFSDIVKRGTLYIKRSPSFVVSSLNLQPWKKRYVILRDTWYTSHDTTSLDVYSRESVAMTTAGRAFTIDLSHVTKVGIHVGSTRFQFSFYVEYDGGKTMVFGAETEMDVKGWIAAVKTLAEKVQKSARVLLSDVAQPSTCRGSYCCRSVSMQSSTSAGCVDTCGLRQLPTGGKGCDVQLSNHSAIQVKNCVMKNGTGVVTTVDRDLIKQRKLATIEGSAGARRRMFRRDRRQDSGFSDSFDDQFSTTEDCCGQDIIIIDCVEQDILAVSQLSSVDSLLCPSSSSHPTPLHSSDDYQQIPSSPTNDPDVPPTPPPRPPQRQDDCRPAVPPRRPMPMRKSCTRQERVSSSYYSVGRGFMVATSVAMTTTTGGNVVTVSPPKPPPRPPHTLRPLRP